MSLLVLISVSFFFFFFFFNGNVGVVAQKWYLFIYYFWLCWVFVSVRGLSLVVASGGHSSSRCVGLSLSRPLLLRSTGFRRAGSVVVAHGPSCPAACGIFPDQRSNPCPLHQQADSQPLRHQGSPVSFFICVSYSANLLVTNSLNLHLSKNIYFIFILEEYFHGIQNSGLTVFVLILQHFKMSFHYLLASIVFDEQSFISLYPYR